MLRQGKNLIKNIDNKINIIEDFISKDTCDFLINVLKKHTVEDPKRAGFHIALNLDHFAALSIIDKSDLFERKDEEFNLATQKIEEIIANITKEISEFYNIKYILKTFCYTKMDPGTENRIHSDNKYIDNDGNLQDRPSEIEDRSVLLYLNDDYEGGELQFPNQNTYLKPKAGTLIFFEGDEDVIHGVSKVISGERINLITFLWPIRYAGTQPEIIHGVETLGFPVNYKNDIIDV